MKHKIISLIALTAAMASCGDFLDVKPVGKLIPSEVSELENLLNHSSVYGLQFTENNSGCVYAMLGDNIRISPNEAGYSYYENSPNNPRIAAYTFNPPYMNPNITNNFWSTFFRAISYYNNVIDGIGDLSAGNSEYARGVVAQARAARAWTYMRAGYIYGPMWNPEGSNDKNTLFYRTESSPAVANPALSTTAAFMELVWQDLEAALADIPAYSNNPTRPGLAAVHAMRAEYHMYKRDWSEMLAEADAAWKAAGGAADNLIYDLDDFTYQYTGNPPTDGSDHEAILNLLYKGQTSEPFGEAKGRENLFYRVCPSGQFNYPSEDFLSIFDPETDMRHKLFALKKAGYSNTAAGVNDGIQTYYLRGAKMLYNQGYTFPEVLLMRAEAYARTGKLTEALADLNTLRRYRYKHGAGDPATVTDHPRSAALSTDRDALINEILLERRREMPHETIQRTLDLTRYVYDAGKPWSKTSITHTIGTQTYTQQISDEYYVLPIDNNIIGYNPQWGLPLWQGTWNPLGKI